MMQGTGNEHAAGTRTNLFLPKRRVATVIVIIIITIIIFIIATIGDYGTTVKHTRLPLFLVFI